MTAAQHVDAAAGLLDRTDRAIAAATSNTIDEVHDMAAVSIAAAQAHALIACAEFLREIGDQLDARPWRVAVDTSKAKAPSETEQQVAAADLLERLAVGGDGEQRHEAVRKLVAHRERPYLDAASIAHHALHAAAQSDDPRLTARVQQAVALLGIEVPE